MGHGAGTMNQTAGKAVVLHQAGAQDIESHQTIVIDVVGLIQVRIPLLGEALFYLILIQQFFEQARYSHLCYRNALVSSLWLQRSRSRRTMLRVCPRSVGSMHSSDAR